MMELLSPASSPEAAVAAVQNGADAVYLGFADLTACREAVNFNGAEFENTVRYCRVRGCRVYLALDILIGDRELAKAGGLALRAQRAGVDAIILRDLGLLRIVRKLLPEMPVFAAASLGFRTPADAKLARALGFSRIFLPPELSFGEISRMAAAGVETAVLAQGSICAAESGTCRFSVRAGRGSADRGLCAAPCRESYSLGGRWDTTPLSFKDRCLIRSLDRLDEAGVTGVLLGEGIKRPEAVAAYTALYSRALHEGKLPSESELTKLEELLSEHGFSEERELASERTPPDGKELEAFCALQRKSYSGESEVRRVPVSFALVSRGEHARIRIGVMDAEGNKAMLDGPTPNCYGDVPLTDEAVQEAMYRTAGTPYRCADARVSAEEGLTVSREELDIARRKLLEQLSLKRGDIPSKKEGSFPPAPESPAHADTPRINFRFLSLDQMTREMAAFKPACIYVPLELCASSPAALAPFLEQGSAVAAVLPPSVCSQAQEEEFAALLGKAKANGVEEVLAPSLGLAVCARALGFHLRGGMELGIFNGYALQNLALAGFLGAVVSPELSFEQIRALPKPIPAEAIIYGRLPAMVTGHCLMKTPAGRCTCTTPGQMADTHGSVWPVVREFGCRNTIYSARKLYLADRAEDWKSLGLAAVQLSFTLESPRECLEVARSYLEGRGYRPNNLTHGSYYKGVR